jgi:hypothetical protein
MLDNLDKPVLDADSEAFPESILEFYQGLLAEEVEK